MKVFISWSGSAEQRVAEALRDALGSVCAGEVEAFVSSQDIPLGERGIPMIEAKLSSTDYGVVVLSAENKDRPWINYEGGALATLLNRRVAVVLLDLGRADVDTPLAPFQSARFDDRSEMLRLFTEIAQYARPSFPSETVETLFAARWDAIQESWAPDSTALPKRPRPSSDMLEELVEGMRRLSKGQSILGHRIDQFVSDRQPRLSSSTPMRASAPTNTTDVLGSLQTAITSATSGRVAINSATREQGLWRLNLIGYPATRRDDFERARELAQALIPAGESLVVSAPLEPSDMSQGRMPWDTLAEIVPEVVTEGEGDRDPLDP